MLTEKKRSSRRLSTLFSSGTSDNQDSASPNSSESTGRLTKVKNRISSATHLAPDYPAPAPPRFDNHLQPTIQPVGSAPPAPLHAPPSIPTSPAPHVAPPIAPGRPVSRGRQDTGTTITTISSGGGGSNLLVPTPSPDSRLKKLKRRSGLFGSAQSSDEHLNSSGTVKSPLAWIVGHKGKVPYNLTLLLNGEKVKELWDEEGDTLVYLFPRTSGKGASFRIDSSLYADSRYMTRLIHGGLYSEQSEASGQLDSSRTASPDLGYPEGSSDGSKGSRALSDATEDDHSEKHLYLPIKLSTDNAPVTANAPEPQLSSKDVDTIIAYRNFVGFLVGQSLVATERHSDIFDVFMRIADILSHYQFSNADGSTFGEIATSSFDCYVDELNIADIRLSREKTIEAIVLGERMRSLKLYTEGFVHAAGKFESLKELQHRKFDMISHKTTTRIARAALDLDLRVQNINTKLTDFDFPAIFSGIMNSDTADEGKIVRFKNWRTSFMACRTFALDYYKFKYGSWLPKAKSKKNNLTTSGLNRLVLLEMYRDLSSLYDLLADRKDLTTRTADGFITEDERQDFESTYKRALRTVLSEYDRSTPPVQPPVPFDLPLYPTLEGLRADYPSSDLKKDAKTRSKKLKSDELAQVIKRSHNPDSEQQTAFLEAFRHFEMKQAHGSTMEELCEMRSGHWLFLYAVLQSLPMLVIDVPNIRFTEGVEYFLCEPPRSGVPWGREDTGRARTWFGVAGGSQVVNLPTDIVEHGVEGVFRRSHCWKMAQKWSQNDALLNAAVQETMYEAQASLPPPPTNLLDPEVGNRSRSQSPDRRRESVMNLGLEALPLPTGGPVSPLPLRPASSHDPNKTFDAILGSADLQATNGKTNGKKDKSKDKKKK
ncbi:hypothetical protein B0J11DRAFT_270921 [Dendryphion nanum]|uniref:DUF8004 domain-containing protein n=1 Tax=Dendryphion nanum TaxID=256645 RepID=A0A9P9DXX0_9PLEO|nr:hypothetical protein B0J11DRAFT_270921 [Dendryphion nanum]